MWIISNEIRNKITLSPRDNTIPLVGSVSIYTYIFAWNEALFPTHRTRPLHPYPLTCPPLYLSSWILKLMFNRVTKMLDKNVGNYASQHNVKPLILQMARQVLDIYIYIYIYSHKSHYVSTCLRLYNQVVLMHYCVT